MSPAKPKPAKGTAAKEKRARRAKIERAERAAKLAAKKRDGHTCRCCGAFCATTAEAAHIDDKGMGGDHGQRSSKASDYVTLCPKCHRTGAKSVHGGQIEIVCLTVYRGNGLVSFVEAA